MSRCWPRCWPATTRRIRLTRLRATPPLLRLAASEPPLPPTLAWVATPFWDRVAPDAQAAFGELVELLAGRIAPFELPASAADAVDWHRTVMEAEIAGSFELDYERGRDQLSPSLQAQIERGRAVTAVAYRHALARVPMLLDSLEVVFEHYDAIVTPATLGTAPEGLGSTGDPLMCTLWTFLGLPASACRCCTARTACRSACSWSAGAATTPGCCARRAGWCRRCRPRPDTATYRRTR